MHFVEVKGILSAQNGMNIYRGCTHGCIYCDSRSKCYKMEHAFEDIEVKQNAPELLEKRLSSKRQNCMIGTGSMSDPYMHCEEQLKLTRQCLEIIDRHQFGLAILTKSNLIMRDMDLLESINKKSKCVVQMTLTTFDDELCKIIEPNVCVTSERAKVLMECKRRGIPTVVWMSPILPFINDNEENIKGLLDICVEAQVKGIICFNMGVTLREGDREYFYAALDKHFPGIKEKYIRAYGDSYDVESPRNYELMKLLRTTCKEHGIMYNSNECFEYLREYPEKYKQISIFDLL